MPLLDPPLLLVDPAPDLDWLLQWRWPLLGAELALQLGLVAFILLRRQRRAAVNLAWITLILAVPVLGALVYALFGEVRLGALRRRRYRRVVQSIRKQGWPHGGLGQYPQLDDEQRVTAALAESVGGLPPRGGNAVELMGNSRDVISALTRDIEQARQHCHLLYYIFEPDESGRRVAAALARAAARGVACRLLVDGVGSRAFLRSPLCRELRAARVQVVEALPARLLRARLARLDLRNHRKLAVIDGQVGYTGSQNIVDPHFSPRRRAGPWVDASLRIRGPAILDLAELFVEDWFLDTEESLAEVLATAPPLVEGGVPVQILPTGPGDAHEALRLIAQASFHLAREEILLTTPYFVPGEAEVTALCTAARRGVRTTLVVPAHNDSRLVAAASRGLYQELLASGVEIHEFTAGLLHAKVMTIDRHLALVGTANFDRRSFELNFEVSALIFDSDFASQVRFLQSSYLGSSRRVSPETWPRRPWNQRLMENAAGLLGPLL